MSNTNTPNGFASRNLQKWNRYYVPASDTNIYRVGDVVRSGSGSAPDGTPTVLPHTGSGAMRGVIVSVDPGLPATGGQQADGSKLSVPAIKTRDYYLWVNDDYAALFTAIDDGLTAANLIATNVGTFVNFTPGAKASANNASTSALTSSSFGGASGSGCFKVLQLAAGSSYGANAAWIVQPANHELAPGGGGGGSGGGITAISQASDYNTATLPAQATAITAAATAASNAQTTASNASTAASGAQATANAAQTAAAAAPAKSQSFALTFNVATVADGTVATIPVPFGLAITSVIAECAAGTTTLTTKIASTAVTGTPVSVSSTKSSQTYSSGNSAAAGQDLTFVASSSSSCTGLAVTATYTRTLS